MSLGCPETLTSRRDFFSFSFSGSLWRCQGVASMVHLNPSFHWMRLEWLCLTCHHVASSSFRCQGSRRRWLVDDWDIQTSLLHNVRHCWIVFLNCASFLDDWFVESVGIGVEKRRGRRLCAGVPGPGVRMSTFVDTAGLVGERRGHLERRKFANVLHCTIRIVVVQKVIWTWNLTPSRPTHVRLKVRPIGFRLNIPFSPNIFCFQRLHSSPSNYQFAPLILFFLSLDITNGGVLAQRSGKSKRSLILQVSSLRCLTCSLTSWNFAKKSRVCTNLFRIPLVIWILRTCFLGGGAP